jgi:hypothetical protein
MRTCPRATDLGYIFAKTDDKTETAAPTSRPRTSAPRGQCSTAAEHRHSRSCEAQRVLPTLAMKTNKLARTGAARSAA